MTTPASFYTKQIRELERALKTKELRVSELEKATSALREREHVLRRCIAQTGAGIDALKVLLVPDTLPKGQKQVTLNLTAALCAAIKAGRFQAGNGTPCSAAVIRSTVEALLQMMSRPQQPQHPAGVAAMLQQFRPATLQEQPPTADPTADSEDCSALYSLAELEIHLQDALKREGCADVPAVGPLHQLVQDLAQEPGNLRDLANLTVPELLQSMREAVVQYGHLLPRYDAEPLPSSGWSAKHQLDQLVDSQFRITLARGFVGKPQVNAQLLMVNLETGVQEPYPAGWWQQVVKVLELADDQKASLKWLWEASKTTTSNLLAQHQQLSLRWWSVIQRQQAAQQQFVNRFQLAFEPEFEKLQQLQQQRTIEQQQWYQQQRAVQSLAEKHPLLRVLLAAKPRSAAGSDGAAAAAGAAGGSNMDGSSSSRSWSVNSTAGGLVSHHSASEAMLGASTQCRLRQQQQPMGQQQNWQQQQQQLRLGRVLSGPSGSLANLVQQPPLLRQQSLELKSSRRPAQQQQPLWRQQSLLLQQQSSQGQQFAGLATSQQQQQPTPWHQSSGVMQLPQQQQQQESPAAATLGYSGCSDTRLSPDHISWRQDRSSLTNPMTSMGSSGNSFSANTQARCAAAQQPVSVPPTPTDGSAQSNTVGGTDAAAVPELAFTAAISGISPTDTAAALAPAMPAPGTAPTNLAGHIAAAPELAFEVWSDEQLAIEEEMSSLMAKVSVIMFVQEMQAFNTLTKKQLALAAVHSYPFHFDTFSVCCALDECGW